jgi:hypothetical protein
MNTELKASHSLLDVLSSVGTTFTPAEPPWCPVYLGYSYLVCVREGSRLGASHRMPVDSLVGLIQGLRRTSRGRERPQSLYSLI